MRYKFCYLIATGLFAGILATTPAVLATDGSSSGSSDTSSSSSSDSTSSTSNDTTETPTQVKEREDRITKLKDELNVRLSTLEETHIKSACLPAQARVAHLNTKFGTSVTKRTQAYTEIQKNLDNLVAKLKAKNVDTTTLEQEITTLKTKIATYATDLATYKQAISDLKNVDCKADPTGFQAALDAARAAHLTLIDDTTTIKTYVSETIKPTLKLIKTDLEQAEGKKENSGASSTNNTTTGGTQ